MKKPGPQGADVVRTQDGRIRRRALFDGDGGSVHEEDEDGTEHVEYDEDSEEEDNEEDDEGLGNAATWKSLMANRASALFSTRAADLQQYIYGVRATGDGNTGGTNQGGKIAGNQAAEEEDEGDDEEFFRPRRKNATSMIATTSVGNGDVPSDRNTNTTVATDMDALDSSRVHLSRNALLHWTQPGAAEGLRNRVVTGDWEQGAMRSAARPDHDTDDDIDNNEGDEVFGDFEDVETGERFMASADPATRAAAEAIKAEELAAKKAAKKVAFNEEYDEGGKGGKGIKDQENALNPNGGVKQQQKHSQQNEEEPETYYDAMKRELAERAQRTKTALDALDPHQRVAMEGHRPGVYCRLLFTGIPCELLENFDPRQPILVGGLGRGEEIMGTMQLRLKRHRWFPKVLKNRDPLIFSIGWRRFQSLPVYAIKDNNERFRMLKYTPEHMHCLAAVWGPLCPPGTGVLAVQKTDAGVAHWRVAATGVVLQLDASVRVVKKLKLVGTPFKIHRHTAFVNGMFNSHLEAAKFEGASIRTVSGIRGTIKKAVRQGTVGGAREGAYRATFEDKPLLSDIVFLRAWVEVEIPRFAIPVTNLLAPSRGRLGDKRKPKPASKHRKSNEDDEDGAVDEEQTQHHVVIGVPASASFIPSPKFTGAKNGYIFTKGLQGVGYYSDDAGVRVIRGENTQGAAHRSDLKIDADEGTTIQEHNGTTDNNVGWVGMKSVADLRRELGVGAARLSDSLYRPIDRKKRVFNPLRIPASLQSSLPFKSKPKLETKRKKKSLEQKRAVVVEGEERKALGLVAQLNAIRNAKAVVRREQKAKHAAKVAKEVEKEDAWRAELKKEQRKRRYVEQAQAEKKKNSGGGSRGGKRARK